ncbi:MAG: anti-sigma regulatory factor [Desulfamplus sp.]|nr:anti-sigma regulatory factor [Desulfamplus sp.]
MLTNRVIEEVCIDLGQPSDNAQVVYTTRRMAAQAGFDDVQQFLIATAASELSTNIIRYAQKGTVTLRILSNDKAEGIEITAIDQGAGISDIDKAMQEHFSTGDGLGLGLPSVKRIMDEFDIHSRSEDGTVIVAKKWRYRTDGWDQD